MKLFQENRYDDRAFGALFFAWKIFHRNDFQIKIAVPEQRKWKPWDLRNSVCLYEENQP